MKRSVLILSLLYLTYTAVGEAAFINYTDVNGKIHYVNTEYGKVPDRYLSQVQDQLDKIKATPIPTAMTDPSQFSQNPQLNTFTYLNPNVNQSPVEVYVKADCKDCERLETLLQANQIKYMRYDVEYTSMGKELYRTMGNTALPITRIKGQIIPGSNINAIKSALGTAATKQ